MPLVISDEMLRAANLTEREAQIEIACRLFDAGRLSIGHAAEMADLTLDQFADALHQRNIPRYRYTESDLEQDIKSLRQFERRRHEVDA